MNPRSVTCSYISTIEWRKKHYKVGPEKPVISGVKWAPYKWPYNTWVCLGWNFTLLIGAPCHSIFHRENAGTLGWYPSCLSPRRSPLRGDIPNKYPLYKVYMGLIIKGTIPRGPHHFPYEFYNWVLQGPPCEGLYFMAHYKNLGPKKHPLLLSNMRNDRIEICQLWGNCTVIFVLKP